MIYTHEATEVKNYNQILGPIVHDRIEQKVNEDGLCRLDLMSGHAIKEMIIKSLLMFAERKAVVPIEEIEDPTPISTEDQELNAFCDENKSYLHIGPKENKNGTAFKYPANIIKAVGYFKHIYNEAIRPDMTKTNAQIHKIAKDTMVLACHEIDLKWSGATMNRRG